MSLPSTECAAFGQTTYRECLLGHTHFRQKQIVTIDQDVARTLIRHMPTLTPASHWSDALHFTSRQSNEASVYDKTEGLIAELVHVLNERPAVPHIES